MTVRCREAVEADLVAMARVRAATRGSEDYWRERILGYMRGELSPGQALGPRVVYVAEEDGVLVGLAAGHLTRRHGCDGELEWIDVVPSRRGSGVADELVRRLFGWFVERGVSRVCVDVQPMNAPARRFYARHGARDLNPHWMVWDDVAAGSGER